MLQIAAGLVLLVLLALSVRRQPTLSFGIVLGAGIAWAGFALAPKIHFTTVPLWLPPLPFALVACALFGFGILAWLWGTRD